MFVTVFLLEFAAFGMERTVLLLSREVGVPYEVASALLPKWFLAVWLLRIAKWGTLFFIAFSWSWGVALVLIVADWILAAKLPIPYAAYFPGFRKRIAKIKLQDAEVGEFLEAILNASNIQDT